MSRSQGVLRGLISMALVVGVAYVPANVIALAAEADEQQVVTQDEEKGPEETVADQPTLQDEEEVAEASSNEGASADEVDIQDQGDSVDASAGEEITLEEEGETEALESEDVVGDQNPSVPEDDAVDVELSAMAVTVKSISYTTKKALRFTNGISPNGSKQVMYDGNGNPVKSKSGKVAWYIEYDFSALDHTGDKLVVTYSDGTKATYVRDADYSGYYVNEKNSKDKIRSYNVSVSSDQSIYKPWGVGVHYFTVTYAGCTYKLAATVVENPVASISFTPKTAYRYAVGKDVELVEYSVYDSNGKKTGTKKDYFAKKLPAFANGDKLQVKTSSGTTKTYIYSSTKKAFVNQAASSDTIATQLPPIERNPWAASNPKKVYMDYANIVSVKPGTLAAMSLSQDPLEIGDNTLRVEYMGRTCAVNLKLTTTAKPSWSGANRIPVSSTANIRVTNGGNLRVKVDGKWATSDSVLSITSTSNTIKRIVGKKAGSTTLYLLDSNGKQVASKKVAVYSLAGNWEIQSVVDSSYVLDIRGKSTADSARMIVWRRNGGKNQQYQFKLQSDGTYGIRCVHSGKYVDVQGGGTAKSQPVIQYAWNGGKNQRWKITVDAKNQVSLICSKSGMAFDIQGGKVTNRAQMIQYTVNSGNNQKWVLNKK